MDGEGGRAYLLCTKATATSVMVKQQRDGTRKAAMTRWEEEEEEEDNDGMGERERDCNNEMGGRAVTGWGIERE